MHHTIVLYVMYNSTVNLVFASDLLIYNYGALNQVYIYSKNNV